MSRLFGIAGLQLFVSGAGKNDEYVATRISQTMHAFPWVSMIVLSELAVCGAAIDNREPLPGPTENRLRDLARKHDVWLVSGSLYEDGGDKTYNTCTVFNPAGEVVTRYRKMFPFMPFATAITAGTEFSVFDVPDVGRFGLSICYDMWMPEHSRTLAAMGAEVILHPVLTGTIDRDVELSIARSTAVMNQCYVVDINGAGGGGAGRSLIVGPEGDVLFQAQATEQIIPLELDLERVSRSRERGVMTLGQPLKSFRDSPVRFEVYDPDSPLRSYLKTLGPLHKPARHVPAKNQPRHPKEA